jgi:hypothetical protein
MTSSNVDFSDALRAVKDGARIARAGWNGKGMWVAYSPGFSLPEYQVFSPAVKAFLNKDGADGHFLPYLMICSVDGSFVPWLASQTDLLADDWEIL